jgi:hypothetical protein
VRPTPEEPRPVVEIARGAVCKTYLKANQNIIFFKIQTIYFLEWCPTISAIEEERRRRRRKKKKKKKKKKIERSKKNPMPAKEGGLANG